jgi:prepilin-type N-terminal cleavage/methylation domain-containing protein
LLSAEVEEHHMSMRNQKTGLKAFTLVELLVVIGIIAVLVALLLPALNKARAQALTVQCSSNMRQVGFTMLQYIDQNSGYLFPANMGWGNSNVYLHTPNDGSMTGSAADAVLASPDQWQSYTYNVWTSKVFGVWNPSVMICPSVSIDPPPNGRHSYILNAHLSDLGEKFGRPLPNHLSPADAILMGEKVSVWGDYYMNDGDYARGKVDEFRHGLQIGSNYLFLDMHVESRIITTNNATNLLDPWNLDSGTTTTIDQ